MLVIGVVAMALAQNALAAEGHGISADSMDRSVKPGDNVKLVVAPLRESDNKGGLLRTLTLIDTGQSFSPNIYQRSEPGLD